MMCWKNRGKLLLDIQIRIYDNSIMFFNSSGLYGNITEQAPPRL